MVGDSSTQPIDFTNFVKQNIWNTIPRTTISDVQQAVEQTYNKIFTDLNALPADEFTKTVEWIHPQGTDPNFHVNVKFRYKFDSRVTKPYVSEIYVYELNVIFDNESTDVCFQYVQWLKSKINGSQLVEMKPPSQ